MSDINANGAFRLGDRVVHPDLDRIDGPDGSVDIEPKAMSVLLCLIERKGDVGSADDLIDAVFALGTWDTLPVPDFSRGTAEYPDRSATLIVETDELTDAGAVLRGPGIKDQAALSLPEAQAFQVNARLLPLGLDFIFTSGARLAALPRSTKVS